MRRFPGRPSFCFRRFRAETDRCFFLFTNPIFSTIKNKKQMNKKKYLTPSMKSVEFKVEQQLLTSSAGVKNEAFEVDDQVITWD